MDSHTKLTAVLGNIVRQIDCDAIVNAANVRLRAGSGVCGAIYAAAGPELEPCSTRLAPIAVGEAVVTPGFRLPIPWIIHTVGPRYLFDKDPPTLLARAITNVIQLADSRGFKKVALPAISTGVYGYPMDEAASVLVTAACQATQTTSHLEEVRFVLTNAQILSVFMSALRITDVGDATKGNR